MNLFDYIKYQSVDIGNETELSLLPIQLIDYYIREFTNAFPATTIREDHYLWFKCSYMSRKAYSSVVAPRSKMQSLFLDALKKYCNEHYEPI